jgi:hypothetical protein
MTRITGFDTAATERRESAEAHRRDGERDLTGGLKRFHTTGENLQSGTGLGDGRSGGEEGDRLRRFGESLKRADANSNGDSAPAPDPRLVAVVEPGRTVAALPALVDGSAERRADALAQSERIARMVEGALRAELSPVPGRPLTLSFEALRPGEAAGVVTGVSLTLQDGRLDVTLSRHPDETQDALFLAAAQALAERLGQRFPKRMVRVLEEAAGAAERDAADGAPSRPSVFDLFAQPGQRS